MRCWRSWIAVMTAGLLAGCATTIAPDTKLAVQGPRAKISRAF